MDTRETGTILLHSYLTPTVNQQDPKICCWWMRVFFWLGSASDVAAPPESNDYENSCVVVCIVHKTQLGHGCQDQQYPFYKPKKDIWLRSCKGGLIVSKPHSHEIKEGELERWKNSLYSFSSFHVHENELRRWWSQLCKSSASAAPECKRVWISITLYHLLSHAARRLLLVHPKEPTWRKASPSISIKASKLIAHWTKNTAIAIQTSAKK